MERREAYLAKEIRVDTSVHLFRSEKHIVIEVVDEGDSTIYLYPLHKVQDLVNALNQFDSDGI